MQLLRTCVFVHHIYQKWWVDSNCGWPMFLRSLFYAHADYSTMGGLCFQYDSTVRMLQAATSNRYKVKRNEKNHCNTNKIGWIKQYFERRRECERRSERKTAMENRFYHADIKIEMKIIRSTTNNTKPYLGNESEIFRHALNPMTVRWFSFGLNACKGLWKK